jgi:hypothetical protein
VPGNFVKKTRWSGGSSEQDGTSGRTKLFVCKAEVDDAILTHVVEEVPVKIKIKRLGEEDRGVWVLFVQGSRLKAVG